MIELKVGEAKDSAIGQIARYMGWHQQQEAAGTVRGILVASVSFGGGRGRATETGAPAGTATSEATRRRSELAGERPHKRPCGGARRLGTADGGRSMTATWADVERAVSG